MLGHPASEAATRSSTLVAWKPPQPYGPPLVLIGQPVHLLGERHHRSGGAVAAEAADLQFDLDGPTAAGQVLQSAPVPIVHPSGRFPAVAAGHLLRAGTSNDPHAAALVLDMAEDQAFRRGN
nr:hypothetical protein [Nonomuraea sp. SYSU D8015]